MTDEYGTHTAYMAALRDAADKRQEVIEDQLRTAFEGHIEQRPVDVIVLDDVTVPELAAALVAHPMILKPLIITCNIASRAIARDVGLRGVNT